MVFNTKGQGALEYLLLIGGAVLIAVIVISIAAGLVNQPNKVNTNEPSCVAFSESRCKDNYLSDVNGDSKRDCTWVTAVKECHACKVYPCAASS